MRRSGWRRYAVAGALALALVGLLGVRPAEARVTLCVAGLTRCECGFFETCIAGHYCVTGKIGDLCTTDPE